MNRKTGALLLAVSLLCTGCMRDIPGGTLQDGIPVEPEYIGEENSAGDAVRPILTLEVPQELAEPLSQVLAVLDSGRAAAESENRFPDVKVRVRGGTGNGQELLAQLLGEAPADLYLMRADYVAGFREGGLLQELGGEFEEFTFLPAARAFCGEEELFAVPYLGYTTALLYNPALMKKAGLTGTPETWSELREDCRQVAAYTEAAGFAGVAYQSEDLADSFTQLLTAFGGAYPTGTQEDGGELVRALAFYRELLENGSTEEYALNDMDRAVQEFWLGRAAMTVGTPAHLAMLEQNGFAAGAAALPGEVQRGGARLHAYAFVIPVGTEEKKATAACEAVRWLLEAEQVDALLRMQYENFEAPSQSPRREGLLLPLVENGALTFFAEHPQYAAFTEEMARAAKPGGGKKWEQFRANALIPVLRRVLTDEQSLEDGVAVLRQRGAEILMN